MHELLLDYMAELVQATRKGQRDSFRCESERNNGPACGASQAYAWIQGRDYVVPEDIKKVAGPVMDAQTGIIQGIWRSCYRKDQDRRDPVESQCSYRRMGEITDGYYSDRNWRFGDELCAGENLRASVGKEPGCPGRISERAVSGRPGCHADGNHL